MPLVSYTDKKFSLSSQEIIVQSSSIIEEYSKQGFFLTLRQLYYQFVSRDLFPEDRRWSWINNKWVKDRFDGTKNADPNYKWLGGIINDARLAGYIDWNAILDRTRELKSTSHWSSPASMVETCVEQFSIDKWEDQPCRVEVWIEKDALVGVIEGVCKKNDVPYFSCRGYNSQSAMWRASQRLEGYLQHADQEPIILHLGDHDPSGIDMTRDIRDRMDIFTRDPMIAVKRIALNMDQINRYQPPPSPAKITDSRAVSYIDRFGHDSWELDALEPSVMEDLIQSEIDLVRCPESWGASVEEEEIERANLASVSENWESVIGFLEENDL